MDILNYRRDGTPFRNGVMIAPLFDDEGKLAWFLGSQVDLGDGCEAALSRRSNAAERVAGLPARQREVLERNGSRTAQQADRLGPQDQREDREEMHRALLLERLGVGTSAEAIRIAVEAGL